MQVKKQQLEADMKQQTGSKLGKAPLMRPQKFLDTPVWLEENTEVPEIGRARVGKEC